eukprot:4304351-Pyramimonas_sp.AAC.1
MVLPREQYASSFADDPSQSDPINFDVSELPPEFLEHEVTRESPGRASPLGFYSDAVPHIKRDSFIA